jgi:tryptophan-rich sensory protein
LIVGSYVSKLLEIVNTCYVEFKTIASILGVILVLIYASGSGIWVNSSPGWYSSLVRPSWQPPDFVFGLIWPYNFVMLGISAVKVSQSLTRPLVILWLSAFALSVTTALLWAYHFYVPHNLYFAAYALGATATLTIPMLALTYRADWKIGALLTPYQIWVIVATTLAFGYAARN